MISGCQEPVLCQVQTSPTTKYLGLFSGLGSQGTHVEQCVRRALRAAVRQEWEVHSGSWTQAFCLFARWALVAPQLVAL